MYNIYSREENVIYKMKKKKLPTYLDRLENELLHADLQKYKLCMMCVT